MNFDFGYETDLDKQSLFNCLQFGIGFSKKIEKIIPGNAFEQKKKKPGLK